MYYIKSEKGYWNTDFSCWETNINEATPYYTYDVASVVAEMVWIDHNIQTEVIGQIGKD